MFLTNHTLVGLGLSQVIDDPILLAPIALGSHFALDSLPHWGRRERWPFGSRPWLTVAVVDNAIALGIFCTALVLQPERRIQLVVGVFFATLPDLIFIIELLRKRRFNTWWRHFHSWVQWSESPLGIITEMICLVASSYFLLHW